MKAVSGNRRRKITVYPLDRVNDLTRRMPALDAERERAKLWYESGRTLGGTIRFGAASSSAGMKAGVGASFHRGEMGRRRQGLLR
jgi:hypothetical protein